MIFYALIKRIMKKKSFCGGVPLLHSYNRALHIVQWNPQSFTSGNNSQYEDREQMKLNWKVKGKGKKSKVAAIDCNGSQQTQTLVRQTNVTVSDGPIGSLLLQQQVGREGNEIEMGDECLNFPWINCNFNSQSTAFVDTSNTIEWIVNLGEIEQECVGEEKAILGQGDKHFVQEDSKVC